MFLEIPDIFSKYLAFSRKYLEKILNIPNIFLSFLYKYHNNDFIKSKISTVLSLLGSAVGTASGSAGTEVSKLSASAILFRVGST